MSTENTTTYNANGAWAVGVQNKLSQSTGYVDRDNVFRIKTMSCAIITLRGPEKRMMEKSGQTEADANAHTWGLIALI